MSIEELYQKLGGSFAEVSERLPSLSLVERFIGKFLQDPSFNDLSESMNMGDRKGAFLASHTLKGICANLGFSALRKSSGELCDELRGEGDSLISAFTALLKDSTQSEDLLCRYGGDEFIILFKNITSEEAQNRINKICTKCKENIIAPGLTLSASCGIALSDDGDAYLPTLIDSADRALYRAKHENKGSFCVWDKINSVAE